MREILFRGKRADDGEWVEGYYANFNSELHYIYTGYAETDVDSIYPDCFEVIPETVGQYTGLCDKNGNMIFEGDIIKTSNDRNEAMSIITYGEFKPTMFFEMLERYKGIKAKETLYGLFATSITKNEEMFLTNNSNLIEVIGNIHDNPELLRKEDEWK